MHLPQPLRHALRTTPRHHRLSPLPADAAAAEAAGPATAVAFAIEAARRGASADPALAALFTRSLATLLRQGMAADRGDPALQAGALQASTPAVAEYVALEAQAAVDQRALRAAVDALAHPGKLRAHPAGPARDRLADLHAHSRAGRWAQLRQATAQALAATAQAPPGWFEGLTRWLHQPALARLERADTLRATPAVQRFLALRAAQAPASGTDAARAAGRASARTGRDAEAVTECALQAIAAGLDALAGAPGSHRVVTGLRPRSGLDADAHQAKDEWDAALLRGGELLLLAEAKAAPAAAAADLPRLRRGLQRLAAVQPHAEVVFASGAAEVTLSGRTLRALQPGDGVLPPQVFYACPAPAATAPAALSAAARATLLAQRECLAYAAAFARGDDPPAAGLLPVWQALPDAARLRGVLHQDADARLAREALLDPRELAAAFFRAVAREGGGGKTRT